MSLFPNFNPADFGLVAGQFFKVKLIWDLGASLGQSTLYYMQRDAVPFWNFPIWAEHMARMVREQIWEAAPGNPLKPALSRIVSNQVRLREIQVDAFDSAFDLLTPTSATVSINQTGLLTGAPEDLGHVINAQFNMRPAALFNSHAPRRSYVALPAVGANYFNETGELSPAFIEACNSELRALSEVLDADGTIFDINGLEPIRIRQGTALVGGNEIAAVGYAAVGSVNVRPVAGFRRSRRGN